MASMKLILLRHAESHHSKQQQIADVHGCHGLTPHGVVQAHRLAARLHSTGEFRDCTTLFCSPVARARQTLDIIRAAIPLPAVEIDPDLREVLPGLADGLTWDTYHTRYGAFDLVAEPDRPFAPEGESWTQFIARVATTLNRLATRYPQQTVVAMTHAGFIVGALLTLFAIPRPGTGARFEPKYTSLTMWHKVDGHWQLERYNDAWHLEHPPTT